MEKNVKISILCDLYGKLLTKRQEEILNDYYNNDLSLSEIAENNDITRQAVRDIIKKGENKLLEYEKKLKFMEKELKNENKIKKILTQLTKLQKDLSNKSDTETNTLENIKKEITNLL